MVESFLGMQKTPGPIPKTPVQKKKVGERGIRKGFLEEAVWSGLNFQQKLQILKQGREA